MVASERCNVTALDGEVMHCTVPAKKGTMTCMRKILAVCKRVFCGVVKTPIDFQACPAQMFLEKLLSRTLFAKPL